MPSEDVPGSRANAMETRVLILPPTSADGLAMGKLFSACHIAFATCKTSLELCATQRAGAGTLIVSEEALLADSSELLACIGHQPVWSDLPVIVLSRSGRESPALAQVIPRLGNVSVVERPVRTSTLIALVRSTLRARDRQYQVREYLAEQEQAQKVIRDAERRYRSLLDNITDYAIFMTDPEGRVSSWNGGAGAILGYSGREILGQSVDLLATQEDLESDTPKREMREAASAGRVTNARWRLRKDGRRLFVEGVVAAVRDDTDRLLGFAHFLRDVTEKHRIEIEREQLLDSERAARSQAEYASRTKDEFLATLSHELRTPLNAILGWTQVLRKSRDLPQDAVNALSVIERNARSQAQIIEDLLDMSSIISGKVRLDVQRLDLASVVKATVETVKPAALAKGIRLHVVLDPLAGPVRGDPNRLQQVFWNLLTNAMKFTHKDGRVTLTLARVNSHLEVEVSDNGEGIDPAFLPHVFDRFRQADASSARRHGGLGLGLSIVKQLVELHGGAISAKSAGRDLGSTFRVSLPLMATIEDALEPDVSRQHPKRSASLSAIEEIAPGDLTGLKVLVVDDEPDARSLIQRLLQDCHASVVTAGSADEALQILCRDTPHVLVSDIGMPGEDGYTLIRRIRSMTGASALVPAIALTAYARIEDRMKAIHAGFQLHLSKPVEPIELVAMVHSLARRPTVTGQ
ncbi:MAG: domain S-box [Gammaproteobacteria bacterium]|nr:domain S-box [Gammaproteobacteria bacterium]